MFADPKPPGATGPGCEELAGKLLLLKVSSIERGVQTSFGAGDAVRASAVDLGSGERHDDVMLWGRVLAGQFVGGEMYVGRIGKGQAQPGKSAPWVFNAGSDDDKAAASRFLQQNSGGGAQAPAPAATAPAPAFTPTPSGASAPPWA